MLARVLELPRQPERSLRKKRLQFVGAVAAGVLVAGGATAAIGGYHAPVAPPEAIPANDQAFVCATAGMHRMGETGANAGEGPVDACKRSWKRIFSVPAPDHMYACVQRIEPISSPPGTDSPSLSPPPLLRRGGESLSTLSMATSSRTQPRRAGRSRCSLRRNGNERTCRVTARAVLGIVLGLIFGWAAAVRHPQVTRPLR